LITELIEILNNISSIIFINAFSLPLSVGLQVLLHAGPQGCELQFRGGDVRKIVPPLHTLGGEPLFFL
jgi:hypothetical protein